jgi:predicted metal-dependent hydrolase
MKNKLTKYEKETIIRFNQDEDFAEVYTCDEAWIRTLEKLSKKDARIIETKRDEYSRTYNVPKKAVKVRLSRIITGGKRLELIARAKKNLGKGKKV